MKDFKTLTQLLDYFKEESTCKEYLEQKRWNGNITCPHCSNEKTWKTDRGYKCASKDCNKKFSVISGTIYENTKIKLRYWFAAMYICSNHKKGISSHQLSRDLGITQKTAWFILHRIREMLKDKAPIMLENETEIDETFIGGAEKNKHKNKRTEGNQGRSVKTKSAVLGILERGGRIVVQPVPNTSKESIQPIMLASVKEGSTIHTDEWRGYNGLNKKYNHNVVKHGAGEYVVGLSHTNNVECFWSHLKRGLDGTYHQVSEKHLATYCNEFAFRYNTRKNDNRERFDITLGQTIGRRLTYRSLIEK